jgi:hypothetical protein
VFGWYYSFGWLLRTPAILHQGCLLPALRLFTVPHPRLEHTSPREYYPAINLIDY